MARSDPKTERLNASGEASSQLGSQLRGPKEAIQAEFLAAANEGSKLELYLLIEEGAEIDIPDKQTGLTALHLVVGRDSVEAAQLLIDRGAKFLPDKLGRMPSAVAAECGVSEAMCDLIAEAEEKAGSV